MGEWDEYCTVCGGPPDVPSFDMDDNEEENQPSPPTPRPNPADYTWLGCFLGISNKEEVIQLASYDSYGGFNIAPDASSSSYTTFRIGCRNDNVPADEKTARGYACHVACYKLLHQELNYSLKCADVLPLLVDKEYDMNSFAWSDYGGLAEYHEQFFVGVAIHVVKDGNLWMLEDPSRDGRNKERILKVWRPLVESGFKRPEAVGGGDGSRVPSEVAERNVDEAKA